MPRYAGETADTAARRLAQQMAGRGLGGRLRGETGRPYSDLSGKDDTGAYFGTTPTPATPEQQFMQGWRDRMFRDSSWLPNRVGQVAIVPQSLLDTGTNSAGYRLPSGYGYRYGTPAFTPGGSSIPSIGVVMMPPTPQPGTPAGWRRGGIRPEMTGIQPPIALPVTR